MFRKFLFFLVNREEPFLEMVERIQKLSMISKLISWIKMLKLSQVSVGKLPRLNRLEVWRDSFCRENGLVLLPRRFF